MPQIWNDCFEIAAQTDLGLRRSNNQDSYGISLARDWDDWRDVGHLFVVADGMGAHAAGELASKLAVDHVSHLYKKHIDSGPPQALAEAIRGANAEIHQKGQVNLSFYNMGTTCSVVVMLAQGALVGHVGDSRVYRYRNGKLEQLTFDHSLVWEMGHRDDETHDNLAAIPKNVITRSLGPQAQVKVDLEGPFPFEAGDTFLLCSDGLTGRVEDREIASALHALAPAEAISLLTNLANLRGGPDNITVIAVKVKGGPEAARMFQAGPLVVAETPSSIETSPRTVFLWIALGLCLLLAGVFYAMGHTVWFWVMSGVAALPGLGVLIDYLRTLDTGGVSLSGGRRLGRSPYSETPATPVTDFAVEMRQALETSRKAAETRGWAVEWTEFDNLMSQAASLVSGFKE